MGAPIRQSVRLPRLSRIDTKTNAGRFSAHNLYLSLVGAERRSALTLTTINDLAGFKTRQSPPIDPASRPYTQKSKKLSRLRHGIFCHFTHKRVNLRYATSRPAKDFDPHYLTDSRFPAIRLHQPACHNSSSTDKSSHCSDCPLKYSDISAHANSISN